jgi:nucleotidyltransferase substrate binding protein (TIGR01987 family)
MNGPNATRRFEQLEPAVARLDEAFTVPIDAPLALDGTIQRFEFAFELAWKAMKAFLELEAPGAKIATPREVIKSAFAAEWIGDENDWLDILSMRNATSHVYNEQMARDVYARIRARLPAFVAIAAVLRIKAV